MLHVDARFLFYTSNFKYFRLSQPFLKKGLQA